LRGATVPTILAGMSGNVVACPSCGKRNRVPVAAKGTPRCGTCKAALPWLVDAGDADLAAALDTKALVLLDLWAPWCGPCRMVAPVLERLAQRYAGRIKVVKVNVDTAPQTAARFDARSIPTLVLLRDGRPVERVVGAQPEPVLAGTVDRLLAA
jgi:thioredoxin 2